METLKSSNEWWHDHELRATMKILDPDGWDRDNMHFSWYKELITLTEFEKRLFKSTMGPLKERLRNE